MEVSMTIKERVDRHDREIAAIRKLILTGMKMINRNAEQGAATRKELRDLAAAQKETEKSLKALMDTMRRGSNGHSKRKVDLQ